MTTLAVLPTVWLRNLSVLSYISAGGVIASVLVVLCLFWVGLVDKVVFEAKGTTTLNLSTLPVAIGLYGYCYSGHAVFPNIYTSMEKPSQYPMVLLTRPTISTFASIIGACSLLSAFEIGLQVQGQLMRTKYFIDIKMGSALVDMYSKCGRLEEARSVFDCMPVRNVFTWTSMIDGYGKNGDPCEALELFGMMQCVHHIEPNYVTFLGALSACGHAGLVAKGKQIFERMERDHSMKPRMEHYACMVDLFGRAGTLSKALEFIMKMPEKPNSDVWAALLSSSRLHGDVAISVMFD